MFRRVLYSDHYYRLSVGLLGGMILEIKERRLRMRIPKPYVNFLNTIVSSYQQLGGHVVPDDEGMSSIFEEFIVAMSPGNTVYHRAYFGESPETHARRASGAI